MLDNTSDFTRVGQMQKELANSEAADLSDQSNEPMMNAEDAHHIADLESRVKSLKQQVLTALSQAKKSVE
jgi:hypothetical protein